MGFASYLEDIVDRAYESLNRVRETLERDTWLSTPQPASRTAKTRKSIRKPVIRRNQYQRDAAKLQKVIERCQKILDKLLDKLTDPKLRELEALKLKEERDAARVEVSHLKKEIAFSDERYEGKIRKLENEMTVVRNHYRVEIANRDAELRKSQKKASDDCRQIDSIKRVVSQRDEVIRNLEQKLADMRLKMNATESLNQSLQEKVLKLERNLEEKTWKHAVVGVAPLRQR